MTDGDAGTLASRTGTLTPERFARVRAIFEAALEQPARDRQGFVKGACVGDAVLLREVEAMLAADATGAPLLDRPASAPTSSAPEEGRFPAGTVLAGRYRILGRLGQGGMGEVYRAHDLILNQTVALKFLAPAQLGEAALARFRNEVRIARQVSHPNVCRVYDLGMVEGLHFLSMEYIDGEDLASLLRRIGRLPQDKAIEFTRKICAGLGAAHERGVLHRDLKPANIMIDGRGQPRITDFGLAGLAAEIPLSDLRSGTPAYMSPEQKAGKDVTVRSDLYSLGLVLHEMFTGKARKDTQSSPSELVKDLDPAIERLILRCLEEDPKRRPSTALSVAMALPGADPIAAALAAGETPSPEMVAVSTEKEGFSVRTATVCLVATLVCMTAGLAIQSRYGLLARAPLRHPPDALADRAQRLLESLGYNLPPGWVSAYGFFCCDLQAASRVNGYDPARRAEALASHRPPIMAFYYRAGRTFASPKGTTLPTNYLPDASDLIRIMVSGFRVVMNADGKLMRLEVSAPEVVNVAPPPDWDVLFTAAGLERARFTPAEPEAGPSIVSDARMAWTGTYADRPSEEVRVEAASWHGHPVLFDVRLFPPRSAEDVPIWILFSTAIAALLIAAGGVTAWRNLRYGRSDIRGATTVGAAVFLLLSGAWMLGPAHIRDPMRTGFLDGLIYDTGMTLLQAGLMWAAYIAVEPYVRRHWPDSLISWTRMVSGRMQNPLVASHLLAGIVATEALLMTFSLLSLFDDEVEVSVNQAWRLSSIGSTANTVGQLLAGWATGLGFGFALVLMAMLLRLLLRRMGLADVAAAVLLGFLGGAPLSVGGWRGAVILLILTTHGYIWMRLLGRFGLVALMAAAVFTYVGGGWLVETSGWFAGRSLAVHLIPAIVAAWAVWVIVSQRAAAEAVA